ncbi:RNA polymerase sigma factor region1.1 domain-containing protein [Methylobacterium sp. NPDC080182]|uniref:RNA polymerase sigma factor region1.1 domain-containing protein n=1 Tax=Methylobacterium sp. NPDC080182 TaxID=3390590 RepID=UPI003CFD4CAC
MRQALDRATLDRLVALGRDRGLLTADDLRAALPVERMDVDALVLVMLELEAAGVSVEPEAFGPPNDRAVPVSVALPAPRPGTPPVRAAEAGQGAAFAPPASAAPAAPEPVPDDGADAGWAVLLAGLATVLILGALLLML